MKVKPHDSSNGFRLTKNASMPERQILPMNSNNISQHAEAVRELVLSVRNSENLTIEDFGDALGTFPNNSLGQMPKYAHDAYYGDLTSAEKFHYSFMQLKPILNYRDKTVSMMTPMYGIFFEERIQEKLASVAWLLCSLTVLLYVLENDETRIFGIHKTLGL